MGHQCPNSPKHIRCCFDTCSQDLKMDLGIILDASGSIGSYDYRIELQFTENLLRQVNVGPNRTHVGIINYSSSVQILTWLSTDYTLNNTLRQLNKATYFAGGNRHRFCSRECK